jgi:Thioredoxin
MQLLEKIPSAYTYQTYAALMDQLHADGKVTGPIQNEDLLQYSLHNRKRMLRIEKTFQPNADTVARLNEMIKTPMIWLTITEGWCGDASQIVPLLEKMAQAVPLLEHRLLLRDEHLDVIDQYLTNGGRAIPITIIIDAQTGEALGSWGPRPADAQEVMAQYKVELSQPGLTQAEKDEMYEDVKLKIHAWYAHDKGISVQTELVRAVEAALGVAAS